MTVRNSANGLRHFLTTDGVAFDLIFVSPEVQTRPRKVGIIRMTFLRIQEFTVH